MNNQYVVTQNKSLFSHLGVIILVKHVHIHHQTHISRLQIMILFIIN